MRNSHDAELHQDGDGTSLHRRTSALEEIPTLVPPLGFPGMPLRRRSTASYSSVRFSDGPERGQAVVEDDDDLEALTKSASAISGAGGASHARQRRESQDNVFELPVIQRPRAAKPGLPSTIREVPSNLPTPSSTRPPSPTTPSNRILEEPKDYFGSDGTLVASSPQTPPSDAEYETGVGHAYPDVGIIKSWRGALVLLCTCGAQLMDNVFMTSVNIALSAIQKDFGVTSSDLQWLISAYTLTFGSFLLLASVLSDRYGRKLIFCSGMGLLSVWTLADGFAPNFISLAIFRALQGVGAAMTVPSAVGMISNYICTLWRKIARLPSPSSARLVRSAFA